MRNSTLLLLFFILFFYGCGEDVYIPPGRPEDYNEPLVKANRVVTKNESIQIDQYIARRKWDMKETGTGLRYMIYKEGVGPKIRSGQLVSLKYKLYLLDGTLCYDSEKEGIKTFEVGHGGVERGLEEGILLLNKDSKARFILPSHLGWGLPGDGNKIPMKVALVYDLEIIDLK